MYYVLEGNESCFYIQEHCPEGYVSCDDVSILIVDKITRRQIKAKGKTINMEESLSFNGYKFYVGDKLYEFLMQPGPPHVYIWDKDKKEMLNKENLKEVEPE